MSDSKPKKNRLLSRNAIALLQLLLAALIVICIALSLPTCAPKNDLSRAKTLSLSEYTQNLLTSEKVQSQSIQLTCLASQSTPFFGRISYILKEYQRISNGKISITFIDPLNHPEQAFPVIERYNLQPTEDLLILDKGDPKKAAVIAFSDLMQFEVTNTKQRKLSAYITEDVVSTTLLALIEDSFKTVYLLSNNTQASNLIQGGIGDSLSALYRNQNINLAPLNLSKAQRIPENASGIVILTPQYDLEPREIQILLNYWNTPKAALHVILDPKFRPKRLLAFLRQHGINPRNDRVFSRDSEKLATKTIANFTQGPQLNGSLQVKSTLFDGISSSLDVRESADEFISKRITPIALVQASESFYSEVRYSDPSPSFDEKEDVQSPIYLAAAVIKGNEMNDSTADSSSRMVVLSNKDFLNTKTIRDEQIDFVKNSINWLVGRPELIGIGPKPLQKYKLNLITAEVSFVNRLTLIILPASFLLISILLWSIRRH